MRVPLVGFFSFNPTWPLASPYQGPYNCFPALEAPPFTKSSRDFSLRLATPLMFCSAWCFFSGFFVCCFLLLKSSSCLAHSKFLIDHPIWMVVSRKPFEGTPELNWQKDCCTTKGIFSEDAHRKLPHWCFHCSLGHKFFGKAQGNLAWSSWQQLHGSSHLVNSPFSITIYHRRLPLRMPHKQIPSFVP